MNNTWGHKLESDVTNSLEIL